MYNKDESKTEVWSNTTGIIIVRCGRTLFSIYQKNSDENADDKGYMIVIVIVSHRHGKSDDRAYDVNGSDNESVLSQWSLPIFFHLI